MSLVPDRVMTFTCAPAERPDSASYTPRTTRNSLIASMLGKERRVRLDPRSTLSAPSTCHVLLPPAAIDLKGHQVRADRSRGPGENLVRVFLFRRAGDQQDLLSFPTRRH